MKTQRHGFLRIVGTFQWKHAFWKGDSWIKSPLKLPMRSHAEERLSTYHKTRIRYFQYNEVHRTGAVVPLLIFWFLGTVLCLWQDTVPSFWSLNLPRKRCHFVWDSLCHCSVEKNLLWVMQVFVCCEREYNSIQCNRYDPNLIVKKFLPVQLPAAILCRSPHALFHC